MEWQPIGNFGTPIQSFNALGVEMKATTNDTIDSIYTGILDIVPQDATALALEIYDITNGAGPAALPNLGAEESTVFFSGSTVNYGGGGSGAFAYDSGSTFGPAYGNSWNVVNQPSVTPGYFHGRLAPANKFLYSTTGQNFDSFFRFVGTSGSMTGRAITRVQARMTISTQYQGSAGGTTSSTVIVPIMVINGTSYYGWPQAIPNYAPNTIVTADWYVNPTTGMQWTPSDIAGFDSGLFGANNAIGFVSIGVGNTTTFSLVEQVQLAVYSAATDLRLAIGVLEQNSTIPLAQGWSRIRLRDTATGSPTTLTLTAGNTYLFSLVETTKKIGGSGSVGLNRLYAKRLAPGAPAIPSGPPYFSATNVSLDPVSHRPLQLYPPLGEGTLTPIVLHKSGGGISADSQPYSWVTATQGGGTGWGNVPNGSFHFSEISYGQHLRQQFTVDANTTFGYLAVCCAMLTTSTHDPSNPLGLFPGMDITIKRQSDNAVMGGPYTINTSDLTAPVTGWQTVGIDIGSVSLVGGTQYYWECTSTAAPPVCWQVQVAISGVNNQPSGPPSGTQNVCWGVNTDNLTIYSFSIPTTNPYNTALIYLGARPPTISGFTATAAGESACHLDSIFLQWTQPTLSCGAHGYYQLQRSDDNEVTWKDIAKITAPTATFFRDYESIRNKKAYYRIRVVRADGTPSTWSAHVNATAKMTGFGLLMVSNEYPAYNVFYPDLSTSRQFSYPQAVTIVPPYGQNYQIALHDLAYRGRTFKSRLAIKSGVPGCPPRLVTCDNQTLSGTDVFIPLQNLCRADLSYVCVHDEHGDRYFANVFAPTAEWIPVKNEIFYQDISVTELTDTPSTPDVTAPS